MKGQATVIFVVVLLVIVVLIGVLIARGCSSPDPTPPTPWFTLSPVVTKTIDIPKPTNTPEITPSAIYTPTVSPTLTMSAEPTEIPKVTHTPTMTPPVWTVTPVPPTMEWAIIRSCDPKYQCDVCYWRCCNGK